MSNVSIATHSLNCVGNSSGVTAPLNLTTSTNRLRISSPSRSSPFVMANKLPARPLDRTEIDGEGVSGNPSDERLFAEKQVTLLGGSGRAIINVPEAGDPR